VARQVGRGGRYTAGAKRGQPARRSARGIALGAQLVQVVGTSGPEMGLKVPKGPMGRAQGAQGPASGLTKDRALKPSTAEARLALRRGLGTPSLEARLRPAYP
jgi:hypothetical protein